MRVFSVIDYPSERKTFGRFKANTPGQAASKAFTSLIKRMNYDVDERDKFVIFSVVEMLEDKEHSGGQKSGKQNFRHGKIYEYVGTRIELHKPIVLGNRVYKFRNIVVNHKDKFFD